MSGIEKPTRTRVVVFEDDDDDDWCPEHGDRWHIVLHESAHAVAAMDFGLEVGALVLHAPETAPKLTGGGWVIAAEVRAVSAPADFVATDPARTFRYFLVGAVAEAALLGDALPDSDDGDLRTWGAGAGAVGDLTLEQLAATAGLSYYDESSATREWVVANRARIEALATYVFQKDTPFEMPFAEVKAFLAALQPMASRSAR